MEFRKAKTDPFSLEAAAAQRSGRSLSRGVRTPQRPQQKEPPFRLFCSSFQPIF